MSTAKDIIGSFFRGESDFAALADAVHALGPLSAEDAGFLRKSFDALHQINKLSADQRDTLLAAIDAGSDTGAVDDATRMVEADADATRLPAADEVDDATRMVEADDDATRLPSAEDADEATRLIDDADLETVLQTDDSMPSQSDTQSPTTGNPSSWSSTSQPSQFASYDPRTTGGGSRGNSWSNLSYKAGRRVPGVGDVLKDRFILEKLVGKGGMGLVYLALDLRKEEAQDRNPHLAVKILSEEFKKHKDSLKALQREARKSQSLAHPNVVNVFDFDRDGDTVYMTMEFLTGLPLDKLIKQIRKEPLPVDKALDYIKQMSAGLAYAHRRGIVHSDFKPGNVYLTDEGAIKILDFGIARASTVGKDKTGEETLFDAQTLGALTPAYASLEMLNGDEPHPSDDIYALGCIAYELLSGQHPYNKTPANKAFAEGLVPKPLPNISRGQWRAIQSAIAFRRDERVGSIETFLEQLDEVWTRKWGVHLTAGAAALFLLVVIGVSTPGWLKERRLQSIEDELTSGDTSRVMAALDEVTLLEPGDRRDVLSGASNDLLRYFYERALAAFNPEEGRYDYPGALAEMDTALTLFQFSDAAVQVNAGRLESINSRRNQLLNDLDARFNRGLTNLEAGDFTAAEQIFSVLEILEQVDPEHPTLSDGRLPPTFAAVARSAVEAGDFEQARSLINALLPRFPDDTTLREELDRANVEERRVTQAVEVFLLEAEAAEIRAEISSVDELPKLGAATAKLADIDPRNPELELARTRAAEIVTTAVNDAIDGFDWDNALALLDDNATYLSVAAIESLREAIGSARATRESTLSDLMATLRTAATAGDIDGESAAVAALAQLESVQADTALLNQARAILFEAHIRKSLAFRSDRDWDAAFAIIEAAAAYASTAEDNRRLRGESAQIEEARRNEQLAVEASERERLERERLAEVAALTESFNTNVNSTDLDTAAIEALLGTLDRLAVIDPANDLVSDGRELIAARLVQRSTALRNANQYQAARDVTREGLALLPASARLASELQAIGDQEQLAQEQARQRQIDAARDGLQALLADARYTLDWDNRLRDQLQQLESVGGVTARESKALRQQIAERYAEGAATARSEQRFTDARSLVNRGRAYSEDFSGWDDELALIALGEKKLQEQAELQARIARIDGLKQTFSTQTRALDVAGAEKTLAALKSLSPNEAFIAGEARQLLAGAYLELGKTAMREQAWERAEGFARRGLAERPGDPDLVSLRDTATRERLKADVVRALTGGRKSGDIAAILVTIRQLSPATQAEDTSAMARAIADRLNSLAADDPERAKTLLKDAQQYFPDNPALSRLEVDAIRESKIRQLLAQAVSAEQSGKLFAADGTGAVNLYQSILAMDANNATAGKALAGIRRNASDELNQALVDYNFSGARERLQVLVEIGIGADQQNQLLSRIDALEAERAAFDRHVINATAAMRRTPLTLKDLEEAESSRQQAASLFGEDPQIAALGNSLIQQYEKRVTELMQAGDLDDAETLLAAGARVGIPSPGLTALATELAALRAEDDEEMIDLPTF